MTLSYDIHPAPPELRGSVECVWTLRGTHRGEAAPLEPILPDGRTEIVIHRAEPFSELGPDGSLGRQASILVTGQGTRPVLLRPSTEADVVGVRLLPGAAARLVRPPLHELTDQIVPMREVASAALVRRFRDSALRGKDDAERLRAVIACLRTVFEPRRPTLVEEAIHLVSEGVSSVEVVARAVGRSVRQVERLFKDEVGISPRELRRVLRFARAVRAFRGGEGWGAGLALDLGYYDQSHMIREIRRFSRVTPGQLASLGAGLTGLFALPLPMSGPSNPQKGDSGQPGSSRPAARA